MTDRLDEIRENAQAGAGPCNGCPAHESTNGQLVNPGLGNPEGDIMFVTEEPRHQTDWSNYDSWREYNEEWFPRFAHAKGGRMITRLLSKTDYSIEDVWIADSIKCPTKPDARREIPGADTKATFNCCGTYLETEFAAHRPQTVVTLGKYATVRSLMALGLPRERARDIRVTRSYGRADFETEIPLVISLHWAQRTVVEDEWVPVVQEGIKQLVS